MFEISFFDTLNDLHDGVRTFGQVLFGLGHDVLVCDIGQFVSETNRSASWKPSLLM